jgi:hypothetical protein
MRLRERSRIASDMHDTLGHELSLIALRAAALQVDPGLPDSARRAAGELREIAAQTTEHLRETIRVLRDDGEAPPVRPGGETIASLVERALASGLAVTVEGSLPSLPPLADRAAYRVVQEALTNAAKHAPGAAVTVRLSSDESSGDAIVTVTNTAPPGADGASDLGAAGASGEVGGLGLVGLDERVRLAGGHLRAGPIDDSGFEVTAALPADHGATRPAAPASVQQFARARRRVRRSLIDAIWLPAAAATVVLLLSFGHAYYLASRSVLAAPIFDSLRTGDSQSTVETLLPEYQADNDHRPQGAPPDPPGTDECRIYRTTAFSVTPAYRICFTQGTLSHKDLVDISQS